MSQALLSRHLSAQFLSASRSIGHARRDFKAFTSDKVFFAQTRSYTCFARGGPQATLGFTEPCPRGSRGSSSSLEERLLMNSSRRSSIRAIRREPISQAQRQAEMEEEAKKIDLAPHKLLQKGDPDSFQAVIKDVNPVGYFLTLPNGREGYLPALDLGFTGGIVILEKLFKVGQELTVRIVRRGGGGREILSMKKPEFAPNTDPRFTFSERLKNMQQGKS